MEGQSSAAGSTQSRSAAPAERPPESAIERQKAFISGNLELRAFMGNAEAIHQLRTPILEVPTNQEEEDSDGNQPHPVDPPDLYARRLLRPSALSIHT